MTFINHAFTGAALVYALFGLHIPLIILGAIIGSLPDTLDWFIHKLFNRPRWSSTYTWFHTSKLGHVLGFPHVWFDHLIHNPVLPRKGENAFMDVTLISKPIKLTRHDIIWLTGEAMLFFFNMTLILIRLSLCV